VTYERSLQLIQEAFDSLHEAQLLEQHIDATEDTILIGTGTLLDSIGFVTFITELEDRIQLETGEDFPLVLGDIYDASPDQGRLTVSRLGRYLAGAVKELRPNG